MSLQGVNVFPNVLPGDTGGNPHHGTSLSVRHLCGAQL